MSDHSSQRVIIIYLKPGDLSNERNEPAGEAVLTEIGRIAENLQGIAATVSPPNTEPPPIAHDVTRDEAAESRIIEAVEEPLNEIVERARASEHLRRAGEEITEAARLVSIEAQVRAQALLHQSIDKVYSFWTEYVPCGSEIVRELLIKEAIKGAIWFTLVAAAARLAS